MLSKNANSVKRSQAVIPIDWVAVDKMLRCGSTGVEVAARLGVHPNTLYERTSKEKGCDFCEYAAQKRANGQALLREAQFEAAVVGKDRTLLIWLGKQMLDQREPESRTIEACKPALIEYLDRLKKSD